jgi:integrase/recombinase XerD
MSAEKDIEKYLSSPTVLALAKSSQKAYGYSLKHLAEYCQGRGIFSFENFQPEMPIFAKWLKQERRITDQSIQQNITNVKIFLNWLGYPVEYTYKISNQDRQAKKRKHSKRWITKEEIQLCLGYKFPNSSRINSLKYRLIIRLLIETGCRAKELSELQIEDIDIKRKTLYLSTSKTEPRFAFFSTATQSLFRKLESIQGGQWQGGQEENRIFPSTGRIKQIVSEMFASLGLKNGKDGRGPHTFRHFFASHLFFVKGVKIEEIAILMGDTIQTVQNVYLHCPEDVLREKLAGYFTEFGV